MVDVGVYLIWPDLIERDSVQRTELLISKRGVDGRDETLRKNNF